MEESGTHQLQHSVVGTGKGNTSFYDTEENFR